VCGNDWRAIHRFIYAVAEMFHSTRRPPSADPVARSGYVKHRAVFGRDRDRLSAVEYPSWLRDCRRPMSDRYRDTGSPFGSCTPASLLGRYGKCCVQV